MILHFIYNIIFIPAFRLLLRINAIFRLDVRKLIRGQQTAHDTLNRQTDDSPRLNGKLLWFHTASVGEYLQCEPVLKQLRDRHNLKICLTFFSPSLEERGMASPFADYRSYLPLDSIANMRRLFDKLEPDLIVFSKYDVWPNMLHEAQKRNCPAILVAASVSDNSRRLSPLSRWMHRQYYPLLDRVGAVSEADAGNLRKLGVPEDRLSISGDARFDQALQFSRAPHPTDRIRDKFDTTHPVLVIGSTSEADESRLFPALEQLTEHRPDLRLVWAPHYIDQKSIARISGRLAAHAWNVSTVTEIDSRIKAGQAVRPFAPDRPAVIVDRMGFLARIYSVADIVYVGGAFDTGVHNLMEPACYAKPLLFGPGLANSFEGREMVKQQSAWIVRNTEEIVQRIERLLDNPNEAAESGRMNYQVIASNANATERIINMINPFLNGNAR